MAGRAKTPEERAVKREAHNRWMWRRVDQLHAELNQGKKAKRRSKGWVTKPECWRIAHKEWHEMRRTV
jgi:hypothetical protein